MTHMRIKVQEALFQHVAQNTVSHEHLHTAKPKRWSTDFQLLKTTLVIGSNYVKETPLVNFCYMNNHSFTYLFYK